MKNNFIKWAILNNCQKDIANLYANQLETTYNRVCLVTETGSDIFNNDAKLTQRLNLVYNEIYLHPNGNNTAAYNKFIRFLIQSIGINFSSGSLSAQSISRARTTSKSKGQIHKQKTLSKKTTGMTIHSQNISSFQASCSKTFIKSKVKTTMVSRIISQSRLSGNKPWLPLRFIQKLGEATATHLLSTFKNDIYNSLYIIIDGNGITQKHVLLKDIDVIGIRTNTNGIGDVFCLYNGLEYRVFTSTGYLNQKSAMAASDFSEIVIDHVTPIDLTLQELDNNGSLPNLSKISDFIKQTKKNSKLSNNKLEAQAFLDFQSASLIPSIDIQQLGNELELIRNASHYRLMSTNVNSMKSNVIDYKKLYSDASGKQYIAFIADASSKSMNDSVIYQDLSTDYLKIMDKKSFSQKINQMKKIKLVDVPIDYL